MAVIGFNFSKISAERSSSMSGEFKVNTGLNITYIKKNESRLLAEKEVLDFGFEFSVNYVQFENNKEKDKIASLKFEGDVLDAVDSKDAKKIIEDWKKKEIHDDIRLRILNTVLIKCNLKALNMEEEIGLPHHIPLPILRKPEAKEEKKK
jgi:hypothetical protein